MLLKQNVSKIDVAVIAVFSLIMVVSGLIIGLQF